MNIDFTVEEIAFLKEALNYAKLEFQHRAGQYVTDTGYRETQYFPKIKMFDEINAKLIQQTK